MIGGLLLQVMQAVFPKKMLHLANICFSAHAIVQPCRH